MDIWVASTSWLLWLVPLCKLLCLSTNICKHSKTLHQESLTQRIPIISLRREDNSTLYGLQTSHYAGRGWRRVLRLESLPLPPRSPQSSHIEHGITESLPGTGTLLCLSSRGIRLQPPPDRVLAVHLQQEILPHFSVCTGCSVGVQITLLRDCPSVILPWPCSHLLTLESIISLELVFLTCQKVKKKFLSNPLRFLN